MLNNLIDQLLPNKNGIKIPNKSYKALLDTYNTTPLHYKTINNGPNPFPKNPNPLVPMAKEKHISRQYDDRPFEQAKTKSLIEYFGLPNTKLNIPSNAYWEYGGYKQAGKSPIEIGLDYEDELENGKLEGIADGKQAFIEKFRAMKKTQAAQAAGGGKSIVINIPANNSFGNEPDIESGPAPTLESLARRSQDRAQDVKEGAKKEKAARSNAISKGLNEFIEVGKASVDRSGERVNGAIKKAARIAQGTAINAAEYVSQIGVRGKPIPYYNEPAAEPGLNEEPDNEAELRYRKRQAENVSITNADSPTAIIKKIEKEEEIIEGIIEKLRKSLGTTGRYKAKQGINDQDILDEIDKFEKGLVDLAKHKLDLKNKGATAIQKLKRGQIGRDLTMLKKAIQRSRLNKMSQEAQFTSLGEQLQRTNALGTTPSKKKILKTQNEGANNKALNEKEGAAALENAIESGKVNPRGFVSFKDKTTKEKGTTQQISQAKSNPNERGNMAMEDVRSINLRLHNNRLEREKNPPKLKSNTSTSKPNEGRLTTPRKEEVISFIKERKERGMMNDQDYQSSKLRQYNNKNTAGSGLSSPPPKASTPAAQSNSSDDEDRGHTVDVSSLTKRQLDIVERYEQFIEAGEGADSSRFLKPSEDYWVLSNLDETDQLDDIDIRKELKEDLLDEYKEAGGNDPKILDIRSTRRDDLKKVAKAIDTLNKDTLNTPPEKRGRPRKTMIPGYEPPSREGAKTADVLNAPKRKSFSTTSNPLADPGPARTLFNLGELPTGKAAQPKARVIRKGATGIQRSLSRPPLAKQDRSLLNQTDEDIQKILSEMKSRK